MHPYLEALIKQKKATGFPSRRGIHGTGDWSTPKDYYIQQVSEWVQCGFHWLKLVAGGDSQLNFCRWLRDNNVPINVILRLYWDDAPNNHMSVELVKHYVGAGVHLFEVELQ